MRSVTVGELKTNFSEILKSIEDSGEKYIVEYGKKKRKVAMLIPYDEAANRLEKRKFGVAKDKGKLVIHDDFAMTEEELLGL